MMGELLLLSRFSNIWIFHNLLFFVAGSSELSFVVYHMAPHILWEGKNKRKEKKKCLFNFIICLSDSEELILSGQVAKYMCQLKIVYLQIGDSCLMLIFIWHWKIATYMLEKKLNLSSTKFLKSNINGFSFDWTHWVVFRHMEKLKKEKIKLVVAQIQSKNHVLMSVCRLQKILIMNQLSHHTRQWYSVYSSIQFIFCVGKSTFIYLFIFFLSKMDIFKENVLLFTSFYIEINLLLLGLWADHKVIVPL